MTPYYLRFMTESLARSALSSYEFENIEHRGELPGAYGWHVDILAESLPVMLHLFRLSPSTPCYKWAGYE